MNLEQLIIEAQNDGVQQLAAGAVIQRHHQYKDIDTHHILLLWRAKTEFLSGLAELPSGKLEGDESLLDCCIRETFEETGLRVSKVIGLLGSFDYYNSKGLKTRQFNFEVEVSEYIITLSPEHDQYSWVQLPLPSEFRVSGETRALLSKLPF